MRARQAGSSSSHVDLVYVVTLIILPSSLSSILFLAFSPNTTLSRARWQRAVGVAFSWLQPVNSSAALRPHLSYRRIAVVSSARESDNAVRALSRPFAKSISLRSTSCARWYRGMPESPSRRNINVIDILLRASIKEKHRGRMKYAVCSSGDEKGGKGV